MNPTDKFLMRLLKLLRFFCPEEILEEIEGDIIQRFKHDGSRRALRRARWRALWNTLAFFRPGILLRHKISWRLNLWPMFFHYLKVFRRHVHRNKLNVVVRTAGLSMAMFSLLAIVLYVSNQLSYDRWDKNYKNIYRVNTQRFENGNLERYAIAPSSLGPMLSQNFPAIAAVARLRYANATYLNYNGNITECDGLVEADASLFDVMNLSVVEGDKRALANPNTIVLAKSIAMQMFGTTNVVNRLITVNHQTQVLQISAVIEDLPVTSHLSFKAIVPFRDETNFTLSSIMSPVDFVDHASMLYVRFKNTMPTDFSASVDAFLDHYVAKKDRVAAGFSVTLQPLADIYFSEHLKYEFSEKGSPAYVYAFSVLGILLLVIAAINYVNLSVADLSVRQRETGIRKVFGARALHFYGQVMLEALAISMIASVISAALLYMSFPYVASLLDSNLQFEMLLDDKLLLYVIVGGCLVIVVAAFAAARYFVAIHVARQLRSSEESYKGNVSRALLFVQFAISAACMCGTLIIHDQVNFIHHKELGFDRENLIVLSLPEDFTVRNMQVLKQELKTIPGVASVSNSSFRIGGGYWKDWYFFETRQGVKSMELYEVFSDDELFETLKIKTIKGRTFDASIPSDSGAAFVINETAALALGYDDPIGKHIYTHPEEKGKWDGTIVGVVSDINISPLYDKIQPLVMRLPWQSGWPDGFIYIRYDGEEKEIVSNIEKKYRAILPGFPLAYRFVDELYNSRHARETKALEAFQFTTLVVVGASMLGILSLSMYFSIRRAKEFGIRKVLGASSFSIAKLQLVYFFVIVTGASIVAFPMMYGLINQWLTTFAYHVDITGLPFVITWMISVLLVVLSAGYSAWTAARRNPIHVIRNQ